MILAACLLWVQSERAQLVALGSLLKTPDLLLNICQGLAPKIALVVLSMAAAMIRFAGTKPNELDAQIRAALREDKVLLSFVYQGDPIESLQQRALLSEMEVQYREDISVVRYAAGRDSRVDARFPVDGPATLSVIGGEDRNDYLVPFRSDRTFDREAITVAIRETIDSLPIPKDD